MIPLLVAQGFEPYPLSPTVLAMSDGDPAGSIRESRPRSSAGGALNSLGSTLLVGDDSSNRQHRAILSFDTAALPDTATITRVTLKLRLEGNTWVGDPLIRLRGFMADLKTGSFGEPALSWADFGSAPDQTLGPFQPAARKGWYALNLTEGMAAVDKTGLLQIRLRFKRQDDGDAQADNVRLFSGDSGAAARPRLLVRYDAP